MAKGKKSKRTTKSKKPIKKSGTKTKKSSRSSGQEEPVGFIREVLFRPDRWEYVVDQRDQKYAPTERACVFCTGLRNAGTDPETLVVGEGRLAMVIMNRYPYNLGHLMVLPKRHIGSLIELGKDELSEVFLLVQLCTKALQKLFKTDQFNIGMNMGKVAGAGIPDHMHVHVLPRFFGDTNFFPLLAGTKVLPGDIQSVIHHLKPLIQEELAQNGFSI